MFATHLSLHTVWIAKLVQSLGKNKNKTGVPLYGLFVSHIHMDS